MLRRLLSFLPLHWFTSSKKTSETTDTVTWSPAPTAENLTNVHYFKEEIQGAVGAEVVPETPPATNGPVESTKSTPGKKRGRKPKSPSQPGKASTNKRKNGSANTKS